MRVFKEQDGEEIILFLNPEEIVSLEEALEKITRNEKNNTWLAMLETLANETDC